MTLASSQLKPRTLPLAVALMLVAFVGTAQAKDIQVTTAGGGSGTCDAGVTSCTTLREAVEHATDGDVIHVPAFHIHVNDANDGEIYSDFTGTGITIVGTGAKGTIVDGGGNSRVFENGSDGILTLENMTVTGGNGQEVPTPPSVHAADVPDGVGGAIANSGSLTIDHVAVRNSSATEGGGIGGNGELTGTDSEVSNNNASGSEILLLGIVVGEGDGGGIFQFSVSLTNTTVSDNHASFRTNRSCVSNSGGGIATEDMSLLNTTIANNSVHTTFVGAGSQPGGEGCMGSGSATGGGVAQGFFFLSTHPQPAFVATIQNTALANNTGDGGPSNCKLLKTVSGGYNISDDDSCTSVFTATGDLNRTDLKLGALQDNGGQTLTRAIGQDSPAFDHIPSNGCPNHDQRDLPRPAFAACDTGAFELQPSPPPPPAPVQQVAAQHVTIAGPTLKLAGARAGCARARTRIRVRLTAAGGVRSVKVTLGKKVIKRTKSTSFTLSIKRNKLRVGHNVLKVVVTDAQGRHVTRRAPLTRCRVRVAPHFTG